MAYTDLSATFVYKGLLTHQNMDQLGENDKVANDLLTAVTDFANFLQFDNTKGIKGEVAATGSYKKLILLDASDKIQIGEAGTEVRVPADPTNVLGVATKQYVDGVQMFETQPKVSASSGINASYVTILSLTATTRGHIRSLAITGGTGLSARRASIGAMPFAARSAACWKISAPLVKSTFPPPPGPPFTP